MISADPVIANLQCYYFYNLVTLGFEFSEEASGNQKVKDTIANHFSVLAGVNGNDILQGFTANPCLNEEDYYLMLYTCINDVNKVIFHRTNNKSEIYRLLNHLTVEH